MAGTTKIKAKLKDGIVEVKALATHPMLSYQEAERAKKEVNFIPFISFYYLFYFYSYLWFS